MIGALVTSTVAMVAVAVLAFWTARRGAAGTLPRNDVIGIRTGATRASDEAWIAAHRAGAGDLRRSGIGAGQPPCCRGWPCCCPRRSASP